VIARLQMKKAPSIRRFHVTLLVSKVAPDCGKVKAFLGRVSKLF